MSINQALSGLTCKLCCDLLPRGTDQVMTIFPCCGQFSCSKCNDRIMETRNKVTCPWCRSGFYATKILKSDWLREIQLTLLGKETPRITFSHLLRCETGQEC